jgi:hypothetical protein
MRYRMTLWGAVRVQAKHDAAEGGQLISKLAEHSNIPIGNEKLTGQFGNGWPCGQWPKIPAYPHGQLLEKRAAQRNAENFHKEWMVQLSKCWTSVQWSHVDFPWEPCFFEKISQRCNVENYKENWLAELSKTIGINTKMSANSQSTTGTETWLIELVHLIPKLSENSDIPNRNTK